MRENFRNRKVHDLFNSYLLWKPDGLHFPGVSVLGIAHIHECDTFIIEGTQYGLSTWNCTEVAGFFPVKGQEATNLSYKNFLVVRKIPLAFLSIKLTLSPLCFWIDCPKPCIKGPPVWLPRRRQRKAPQWFLSWTGLKMRTFFVVSILALRLHTSCYLSFMLPHSLMSYRENFNQQAPW